MSKMTIFKNAAGKRLPSVSTIIGQLDKPALIHWAHKLGLQGVNNLREYRDAIGKAGTLAHELGLNFLASQDSKIPTDELIKDGYTPEEIQLAIPVFKRFTDWVLLNEIKTEFIEKALVSEIHQFGGRLDWYGELNGEKTLIDFKFTKDLYDESVLQIAAYRALLVGNGYKVDRVVIVRFGRNEDEGYEFREFSTSKLEAAIKAFLLLRDIYAIKKLYSIKEAA